MWKAGSHNLLVLRHSSVDECVSEPAAAGHTEFPFPLTEWRLNKRLPHCSTDWFVSGWQRLCPDEVTPQERSANCPVCTCCHRVNCVCAKRVLDVWHCKQKAPVQSHSKNPQHYFLARGLSLTPSTIWRTKSASNSTADCRADRAVHLIIIPSPCPTPVATCNHSRLSQCISFYCYPSCAFQLTQNVYSVQR